MSKTGRIVAIAVVWLVILGLAVLAYRIFSGWSAQSEYRTHVARYEKLSEEAKKEGLQPQPKPLPANADVKTVQQMTAELQERLDIHRRTISAPGPDKSRQRVAVALDSFSGYCLVRGPELRKELAAAGIDLDLVDDKADYPARLKTLQSGQTPLALFTIDALIKASASADALPGAIVLLIDETRGADAMVAYKKALPNIDALNRPEARIVATRDSPSETLARVVQSQFSLPRLPRDCFVDAKDAEDVYQKFKTASKSDPWAFALWEPYVSKALEEPDSHVLIDSSRFRGYIVDVLVVERKFLLQNEKLVENFVKAYLKVAYAARKEAEGMKPAVRADLQLLGERLTDPQIERLVAGIWWKNTQENYGHFGISSSSQELQGLADMIRNITEVLVKTQAIPRDPTAGKPNTLYYDKILRRLHEENFHPDETIQAPKDLAALTEAQWKQLAIVGTLPVEPLVFGRISATLTEQAEEELRKLVDTLRTWPQYYLEIRGHARKEGDAVENRKLAQERANAAFEFLVREGIPKARLRTVSTEPREGGGQAQTVSFVVLQVPF